MHWFVCCFIIMTQFMIYPQPNYPWPACLLIVRREFSQSCSCPNLSHFTNQNRTLRARKKKHSQRPHISSWSYSSSTLLSASSLKHFSTPIPPIAVPKVTPSTSLRVILATQGEACQPPISLATTCPVENPYLPRDNSRRVTHARSRRNQRNSDQSAAREHKGGLHSGFTRGLILSSGKKKGWTRPRGTIRGHGQCSERER